VTGPHCRGWPAPKDILAVFLFSRRQESGMIAELIRAPAPADAGRLALSVADNL